MKFMSENVHISISSHVRTLEQHIPLSTQEIQHELEQSKHLHDLMFKLEDRINTQREVAIAIHHCQKELAMITPRGDSGIWKLRDELNSKLELLDKEEKEIRTEISLIKDDIEIIFNTIEAAGDTSIKQLAERRREYLSRRESHQCEGIGNTKNTCIEIDKVLPEITCKLLMLHTEQFWSKRSLQQFKPSLHFPHPGAFQAHPAYMDIKAVADGSQKLAIVLPHAETDGTDELISKHHLSVMFITDPVRKVIYTPQAYHEAQQMVALIETKGNSSRDPEIIYNYYKRMGYLLGQPAQLYRAYALQKAQKLDPDFEPSHMEQ